MRIDCYLIVSYAGSVSVRKSRPKAHNLRAGELVLPLAVTIPNSAFAQYLAQTQVNVPESGQYQAAVELVEEPEEEETE
jgi:hypothetical protein